VRWERDDLLTCSSFIHTRLSLSPIFTSFDDVQAFCLPSRSFLFPRGVFSHEAEHEVEPNVNYHCGNHLAEQTPLTEEYVDCVTIACPR
jgi:hypothetical protein